MDWTSILLSLPLSLCGVLSADMWRNLVSDPEIRTVTNLMGGTSTLDSIADGYLLVHTTTGSTIEAQLRPDSTIDVILSVDVMETRDSELRRYDCHWQRLESPHRPEASHFYHPSDSLDLATFSALLQPLFISMRFDAEGQVTYAIEPEKYLPKETFDKIKIAL